jgi:hypothetical protein
MAKEYQGLTGKTIGFSSGARNPLENQRVGGVGSSLHLEGKAVDLSSDSVAELAKLGLLDKYGFKQNRRSPWHISDTGYRDGGIAIGPKSGYEVLLHGTEAVVPLPDGKNIPVKLDQADGALTGNRLLQVLDEVKSSMKVLGQQQTPTLTSPAPRIAQNIETASEQINNRLNITASINDAFFNRIESMSAPRSGYNTVLRELESVVPALERTITQTTETNTKPMADNTELLQVMREVKSSIESMTNRADNQRVVAVIEDSIRTQRTSNDILQKILQMSQ